MRILYLDIDSLRPDHLGCYGYHRDTSPNIDALAKEGVRFSNYYCSDSPCLPSRTALITGRCGLTTGVVNHGGVCSDIPNEGVDRGFRSRFSATTLGAVLRQAGMWTASISPFPWRHTAYQFFYGFNETLDTGKGGLENADEIYPHVQSWLSRNGSKDNWFLHVNLWDPHTPYDAPTEFGNPFADEPIEDWITEELILKQRASYGPHSATEVRGFSPELDPLTNLGAGEIRSLADAKRHMDGYDTGIRYADLYVGKIFDQLKQMGLWDETVVIVSADHGEAHGELNVWGDHQCADQATNNIPLIIRWPGKTEELAGQENPNLYYQLDFAATLVDMAGGKVPQEWEGASFAEKLRPSVPGRDHLVLSQGAWSLQRSVRWKDWLLIRTYHTGLKEYPEWMLFDVVADPHETANLAESHPDAVAEGRELLDRFVEERLRTAWRGDPFDIVLEEGGPYHANENSHEWKEYLERLRKTGRAHHAEWLEQNGGKPR